MVFPISVLFVSLLIALFIARRLLSQYVADRHYRRFMHKNGCAEPPRDVNKLPGGIEKLFKFVNFKGDLMDDIIIPPYYELGWTYKTTGTFGKQNIMTTEPQNIQALLVWRFKDFQVGEAREHMFGPLLGYGIATSDGPFWEHSRALMTPQFSRDQITDFHDMEVQMQNLFKAISVRSKDFAEAVDLMPIFYRFTLDIATEFLFGQSVFSQLASLKALPSEVEKGQAVQDDHASKEEVEARIVNENNQKFAEALQYAMDFLAWRLRLQGLYWLCNSARFREACTVVHRFADRFVDRALHPEKKKSVGNPSVERKERFVLLDAIAADSQNPRELRNHLLQVLNGGRDTTGSLLTWLFALLPRYPDVFHKLRSEILSVFGAEDDPNRLEITADRMKSINYLRWFVNETLRLFPVVPNNNRIAACDTVLPRGGGPDGSQPIAVMKGQVVAYTVYGIHRRKDIWGPDAAEFKPERWENRKPGPEFLPFNTGPRVCIGQQFALNEVNYVVVRMLQRFDKIELADPNEKLEKKVSMGLTPANGAKVRLHHRRRGMAD
ncbi:MAG: hypothetical protein M1837_002601 [Sclerophora amabilis]|nr:MAG: hypothetical protein M1837_002601 [Sclerophora amabilis]